MKKNKVNPPRVSVIMPVYNASRYLEDTIGGIIKQTYKNFEFIIIDDCSTDNSLKIIQKYAKIDKRIKVIRNKINLGIAKTRNRGLNLARGEYIATHDADDISIRSRFKEQVKFLDNNPRCGAVGAYIQLFGKKSRVRKYPLIDSELRKIIFFFCPIAQPVSMIRREVFSKIGYYDEKYPPSEDLDIWFRIGNLYELRNIPKILLKYRESPNSQTSKKIRIMEKKAIIIRWKNLKNKNYPHNLLAIIYILMHAASLYLIPSRLKSWIFSKLRDRNNEET